MKGIILASASERRSQILNSCRIDHLVIPSDADEIMEGGGSVEEIVKRNAEAKASKIARDADKIVIIGADTLVTHGKDIIGKPRDEEAAKDLLRKFSGSDIEVYTGLCVLDTSSGKKAVGSDKSEIKVASMAKSEVEDYFKHLAPYDKAGGFSIEGIGALLFDDIRGSYFNILGLPVKLLNELFREIGLNLLDFIG